MTEQVIDIRDRIEKMRNQMTVPGQQSTVQNKKVGFDKNTSNSSTNTKNRESESGNQNEDIKVANDNKLKSKNDEIFNKSTLNDKNLLSSKIYKNLNSEKINNDQKFEFTESINDASKSKPNYKKYEDYQNDRIKDENKQSIKFEDKQSFPQFSLNVSNPISWKLMLLIMLMQLLTNMMLVVVLYLK